MIATNPSLAWLSSRAQARLLRLRTIAFTASNDPFPTADRLLTYVAIQALNEWADFVRAFLMSCVSGASRANGATVSVSVAAARRIPEMMRIARHIQSNGRVNAIPRRRRDEPRWHDVRLLVDLAARIGLSNQSEISAAVSTGSPVFSTMPVVRNFYAHRNMDSKSAALSSLNNLSVPQAPHPTLMLVAKPAGSPNPLVVELLDDIYVSVNLIAQ